MYINLLFRVFFSFFFFKLGDPGPNGDSTTVVQWDLGDGRDGQDSSGATSLSSSANLFFFSISHFPFAPLGRSDCSSCTQQH